ncbi:MAG: hypothetical protein M1829_005638 [Trizodia sp. TS-e1964]|nr:MAG: hypothetical protein M1829_005638 [Trizodia sp. TS-e1964]
MARPSTRPSTAAQMYLTGYNLVSALLWTLILARTLLALASSTPLPTTLPRVVQTLALLEPLHSLSGLIAAPLPTTLLQIASRLLLTWGIVFPFPALGAHPAYASMLVAWSATEVVRYAYFATNVRAAWGGAPALLVWLRYNTFFVLYPVGVVSEMLLVYAASGVAPEVVGWALLGVLAVYPPGFYVMFTHMMKQRRKVRRGKAPVRN